MENPNKEKRHWSEEVAMRYLVSQGYAIVEQNWRMNHLEVDIIASKDNMLIFVEVKQRKEGSTDPVDAVNRGKRQRIIGAADVYLRQNQIPLEYRFDIVAITGIRERYTIEHIPEAYHPSLKSHNYKFKM